MTENNCEYVDKRGKNTCMNEAVRLHKPSNKRLCDFHCFIFGVGDIPADESNDEKDIIKKELENKIATAVTNATSEK